MRKELEQQMMEEIEHRVQEELERRAMIKVIFDSLEEFGELPEELRRIIEKQKDSETLRKWNKMAEQADSIEKFRNQMKNVL